MGCSQDVCLFHTAIYGTYLAINNGRETEVIKYLCTVAPDVDRPILPLALIIEAIDLRMQEQQTQTLKFSLHTTVRVLDQLHACTQARAHKNGQLE